MCETLGFQAVTTEQNLREEAHAMRAAGVLITKAEAEADARGIEDRYGFVTGYLAAHAVGVGGAQ